MQESQRKAMFAKIRPTYRMGNDAYSREDIAKRKAVFGKQGTTKYLGSRCMHCGGNDATFKHYRSCGGGKVQEVRCIRCGRNAGM